jgi:A/G-specific adenine glycosylase
VVATLVATVVGLRRGRVLTVTQRDGDAAALPGGKLEPGEGARDAAVRELREETGIAIEPERLVDLGLRLAGSPAGVALIPFAVFDPPPPASDGEHRSSWIALTRLDRVPLAPGVARSVHAGLACAQRADRVPDALMGWWHSRRLALPWRATRDPYAVLVCEVMSQQTQIDRVRVHWERWMALWPSAEALAGASLAEVLAAWQGLGYPRRARDLLAAARQIAGEGWPAPERLTELPGIGPYTADAIRCFALEQPVLPRDANVRRVLARRFPGGVESSAEPWALGGALMDLGREHCRASPRCDGCALRAGCMVPLAEPGWDPAARPRRQSAYAGSLRERRGALLRAALAGERPPSGRDPQAAASLVVDGLVAERDGVLVVPGAVVGHGPCSS